MKNFEITKEQILELENGFTLPKLKQWFPDAFKVNKKSQAFTIDFVLWLDENYYQHEITNNCYAASKTAFELEETFTVKQLLKKYKKLLNKKIV